MIKRNNSLIALFAPVALATVMLLQTACTSKQSGETPIQPFSSKRLNEKVQDSPKDKNDREFQELLYGLRQGDVVFTAFWNKYWEKPNRVTSAFVEVIDLLKHHKSFRGKTIPVYDNCPDSISKLEIKRSDVNPTAGGAPEGPVVDKSSGATLTKKLTNLLLKANRENCKGDPIARVFEMDVLQSAEGVLEKIDLTFHRSQMKESFGRAQGFWGGTAECHLEFLGNGKLTSMKCQGLSQDLPESENQPDNYSLVLSSLQFTRNSGFLLQVSGSRFDDKNKKTCEKDEPCFDIKCAEGDRKCHLREDLGRVEKPVESVSAQPEVPLPPTAPVVAPAEGAAGAQAPAVPKSAVNGAPVRAGVVASGDAAQAQPEPVQELTEEELKAIANQNGVSIDRVDRQTGEIMSEEQLAALMDPTIHNPPATAAAAPNGVGVATGVGAARPNASAAQAHAQALAAQKNANGSGARADHSIQPHELQPSFR